MDSPPRHILLTGATGLLGSYLLPRLLGAGYRVRALYREDGTAPTQPPGESLSWCAGDLLDPESLETALQGIDAVVHAAALVSYQRRDRERLFQINETGTANLVNAALYRGVPRFVHVGSVATLEHGGLQPASEDQYWPLSQPPTAYGQSKFQAQREVWRGRAEGLSIATIFPAVLVGAAGGRRNPTLEQLREFSVRYPRFYPTGGNGFVAATDVAEAILRVLARHRSSDRYVLSAVNWSYRELLAAFAAAAERPAPTRALPARALRWLGRLERWRGGPFADLLSPEAIRLATTTFHYDGTRAERELDLSYTPIPSLLV